MDSRSPNLTNARYRTLREEAREKGEGGSFIDTAGLFYAIRNYAITDVRQTQAVQSIIAQRISMPTSMSSSM